MIVAGKIYTTITLSHLACIFAALAIGACATPSALSISQQEQAKHGLVARDLLYVMAQILPPNSTTVQVGTPNSSFGLELENGFREIGYGMQRMEADQGPMFVTYSEAVQSSSRANMTLTFAVFVGEIGLERTYANKEGGGMAPLGPMRVFGTNQAVDVSDQLFAGDSLGVSYVKTAEPEYNVSAITVLDEDIMAAITTLRTQPSLPSYKSLNSQNVEIENLFRRGSSNFSLVDRDYRVVRKDIIVFADDSLQLLNRGRAQIDNLLTLYKADSDVFRLVGCSNGPTSFEGGNVGLALGRSERVAKELLSRKVRQSAILDEGCWAGEATDEYPSRGVVIELQRKNS